MNGSVRLAGSPWSYQGRVEVCVNNTWGTICTTFWDTNDTAVVCQQLGFSSSGIYSIRFTVYYYHMTMYVVHVAPLDSRIYNGYGERYLPLHVIDINCTGEEATIWDCPHNAVVENSNCRSYYRDAAVTCLGKTYSYAQFFVLVLISSTLARGIGSRTVGQGLAASIVRMYVHHTFGMLGEDH